MALEALRSQKLKTKRRFGRIGVLMGGVSRERAISLKSGRAVYKSLKEYGLEVAAIDIKTEEPAKTIRLLRDSRIDIAFIALHGYFGEDGTVQGLLQQLGIPYTGSGVLASRRALNKIISRRLFCRMGLTVPRHKIIERQRPSTNLKFDFDFPLVVKPCQQGSSIGLSIVDTKRALDRALEKAFSFDNQIIVEEYIAGREITVGLLAQKPLPVIEIVPRRRFFDYQAKYSRGMTDYIVPAKLNNKITRRVQAAAVLAHKSLGCYGISRVDMILAQENIFVLEVNSIPGLTQRSLLPKAAAAAGINFTRLCIRLLELGYEKKEQK
jgi:D-alanine-D-alanine ligase